MEKETKLKLKHIAPYLPYRLKMYAPHGFRPNGKESTGEHRVVFLTGDLYADIENKTFGNEQFLPILRPLSDLVKEIDGSTGIIEMAKMYIVNIKWRVINPISGMYSAFGSGLTFTYCASDNAITVEGEEDGSCYNVDCALSCYDYLFENHYDVFRLIEQGLAIDINTIEK